MQQVGLPGAEALPAAARPFFSGSAGRFILSADRLFGVSAWSATGTTDEAQFGGQLHLEYEASGTMVNLLWSNTVTGDDIDTYRINVYAMPRLSFDGFVTPYLTVGGSIGYISLGGSTKTTSTVSVPGSPTVSATSNPDLPDISAVLFTPRVGFVVPAGPNVSFWLRGGITYFHISSESTFQSTNGQGFTTTFKNTQTRDGTALSLDPQLVIMPVPHAGITLGAVFDISLGGSFESEATPVSGGPTSSQSGDSSLSNYGGAAGVLVLF